MTDRELLVELAELTAELAAENADAGDPVDPGAALTVSGDASLNAALAELDDALGVEVGWSMRVMLAELGQFVRREVGTMH